MAGARLTLLDVLNPLTESRRDVEFTVPGPDGQSATIDGSHLWELPGAYDADTHLPILDRGLRTLDHVRALAGGATTVNAALPWHLVEQRTLADLTAWFGSTSFPRILPILSISHEPSSEGFPRWLAAHANELKSTWMPVIKLYSNDPWFRPNLEAIWEHGFRAAIYFYTGADFEQVVTESGGPVHFRHVTSQAMLEAVRARPDSTCQTSPHFLLDIGSNAENLHVLPPVPGGEQRRSLVSAIDGVDLIASDHNAPVLGNEGPGLEIDQHFLPALLTACSAGDLDLGSTITKVTQGPIDVFAPAAPVSSATILLDPTTHGVVSPWPGQEPRRAAYLGLELTGTVVAVVENENGFLL